MKLLGLTGGMGMGKSACAELLRRRGVPVIDTDDLAHQLVEPGQPALREVVEAFGPQVIGSDGRLCRDELASQVFSDPAARRRLEAILHPRIRDLWRAQVAQWSNAPGHPLAVVVIPLLFETGAQTEFDATLCVACSSGTQHQRLSARGWPPTQIAQRIETQLPANEKAARADFLIWTEGPMTVHAAQLDRVLKYL